MQIKLHNLKPQYMSESEVAGSDIYLQPKVIFGQGSKYLVRAKSGHGKTSLLNFIYGTNPHFDGTIEFSDSFDPSTLKTSVLSYMFQDLCLFPELTAFENVRLKNNLTGHKTDAEINEMLDILLPPDKKDQPLKNLSLGQRQRVAAVRALCQPFRFLLLDEPFSHIDNQTATKTAQLIANEVQRQQAGLIVTALEEVDCFDFDKTFQL